MQKRWFVKSTSESTTVESLRSALKIDRISAELLLQRGIRSFQEAEAFFEPKLEDLHNPFKMKDMDRAVDRLQKAISEKKKVLLFGDYDVDGTTAVALLYSFLKKEMEVDYYIPDRYQEGYGLSMKGIEYAAGQGIDLVITLDCGVKSTDLISAAKEMGIDFIVCDHHTPGDLLPDAIVLDPKRKDCEYPYKELSGCGVGFKLLQAYLIRNKRPADELWPFLDLLALSIGADIVDVTGENRILAHHGLKTLNQSPRTAFKELIELAGKSYPLNLTDVVFTIAPRINAAGRLRSGRYAVELMISDDREAIRQLAIEINEDNKDRRVLDEAITREALAQIEQDPEFKNRISTVVWKEGWHKGVVGIVASRLIEQHYRPTIVLTSINGLLTGSARSVKGVDLYHVLDQCAHLLEQFGGHTHAAGLTLRQENLEEFKELFDKKVAEMLPKEMRVEEQVIDLTISFEEIFRSSEDRMKLPELMKRLQRFEPHGPGNMRPVFSSDNVLSRDLRVLKDKHLKLQIFQPDSDVVLDAIGFNLADKEDSVTYGMPYDVVYTMEVNRWQNREMLQLNIKDVRDTLS